MKATPSHRNTLARIAPLLMLAGTAAALPARAALQHLDDQQLAQVQGRSPLPAQQLYHNFVTPIAALSVSNGPWSATSITTPAQLQTLQFDAADWLSFFGLHYDGPSMGLFRLNDVDTSGLTITLQPHR